MRIKKAPGRPPNHTRRLKEDCMDTDTAESAKEQTLSDEEILRRAQEKLLRRRAELGIKVTPGTTLTSGL
jgi:hypothetical protein